MCTSNCCLHANIQCGQTQIIINTPGAIGDSYTVKVIDAQGNIIDTVAECTTTANQFIIEYATLPAGFATKDKRFTLEFYYLGTSNPAEIQIQTLHNCIDVELGNKFEQIGVPY